MSPPRPAAPLTAFEVEIFLTNRCNLACSYCSFRHMRDDREAKRLTFDQLKRFVNLIASDKNIKDKFAGPVSIEFAGGEPLMEFELLKKTVDYIRARKIDFEISIATNGTLLSESRIDYLVRNNVDIRISLDGLKRVNDRHRVFAHDRNRSVFDAVMKNLKTGFPTERHMARCNISPTLSPQDIDTLPDVVKFFRREVGIKKLRIGLEAFGTWSQDEIVRFRKALRKMVSGFLATLKPGADARDVEAAFGEFPLRQDIRCYREGPERATSTLALLYDGYFYPSPDFVVAPPPLDTKYRVGNLERGIDFKKLERVFAPMLTDIARACGHKSGPRSPVEGYYWGVVNKFPPDKIGKVLESTSEVNRVFREETRYYMRLHRIFKRLLTTPGFGDFAHSPKYKADKEIRTFRMIVRNDPDIIRLRKGVDYFLYSPGSVKELVLDAMDGGACSAGTFNAMEGIVLYAMMKAGYLKKKPALAVSIGASALDAELRSYLNEHRIRVEIAGTRQRSRGRDIRGRTGARIV